MFLKALCVFAIFAVANAGYLSSPLRYAAAPAYSYAAPAISYVAPTYKVGYAHTGFGYAGYAAPFAYRRSLGYAGRYAW